MIECIPGPSRPSKNSSGFVRDKYFDRNINVHHNISFNLIGAKSHLAEGDALSQGFTFKPNEREQVSFCAVRLDITMLAGLGYQPHRWFWLHVDSKDRNFIKQSES